MALTLYQEANKIDGDLKYPHSCKYPALFSATSTMVSTYYDFKYHWRVYDYTGLLIDKYSGPTEDLIGRFNPVKIIESFLVEDLSEVKGITAIEYLKEYRITVQEFYDGEDQGTEEEYNKSIGGGLGYNQTDSIEPYTITNEKWGDFLTNQQPEIYMKMSEGTRGSWMLPTNTNFAPFDSIRYHINYEYATGDIFEWVYGLDPHYFYDFDPTGTTIENISSIAIKIPIGYKTLTETVVYRYGYWSGGVWYNSAHAGQVGVGTHLTNVTPLDLMVRTQSGSTRVSNEYRWDIGLCDNKDITISWINSYGGIDIFNFNKVRKDTISNKRKNYIHNNYDSSSNGLYTNTTKTNKTTYLNDKQYTYNIKTDLLNKSEIELLKGLWVSDNIEMIIDDIVYPITAITNKQPISYKENPEFIMYKFDVSYAKIMR